MGFVYRIHPQPNTWKGQVNINDSLINMEGELDGGFLLNSNHFNALQYDIFLADGEIWRG